MSKRSAAWQGGEERYGGPSQPEEQTDRPMQATAAQLAKRKIAQAKGSRRPRSESPLTNTGSIFEQATSNGLIGNNNNATPSNPFASFGNGNSSQTGSFNSGGGSFVFGAGASGQNTAQTTPNMNTSFTFGANAPAPSIPFAFGQTPSSQTNGFGNNSSFGNGQQNGNGAMSTSNFTIHEDQQTPKASNPFGAGQSSGSIFGNTNSSSAAPTSNGFTFGTQPKPVEASSTPSFTGFGSTSASQPAKPASDAWSSFTSKPAETPKPATNGFVFGTTATNGSQPTNGASSQSLFSGFGAQNKMAPIKFSTQPDDDASMMSPENTPQKPVTDGAFAQADNTPKPAVSGSLFDRISRDTAQTATNTKSTASASLFDRITQDTSKGTTQPPPSLFAPSAPKATSQPSTSLFAPPPKENAQPASTLFSGFAAPSKDGASSAPSLFANAKPPTPAAATSLFTPQPSAPQAAPAVTTTVPPAQAPPTMKKATSMSMTRPEHFSSIRELNAGLMHHLQSQDLTRDLSSILEYYLHEVKTITSSAIPSGLGNSLLGRPTQAATASSSGDTGATVAEPLYPKLPDNASATAKYFAAAIETPAAPPASSSLFAKQPEIQSKPAGFMPSSRPSGSFLSSFGDQAAKTAEREKKRRRDEDFDSDEENEADWEKRDAEEQAAKRSKLEEAAKSASSFTFKPMNTAASATSNMLAPKPVEARKTEAANGATGFTFKPNTTATSANSSLFAPNTTDLKQAEPALAADHTWKQGTPIKFDANNTTTSATPAPKFNLFGAVAQPPGTSLFASTTKPADTSMFSQAKNTSAGPNSGFTFGQPSGSTPADTTSTDAGTTEDGDAEPPLAQLDDLAVLLPSEKEESDVLYHVEKSKSKKLETRAAEGGTEKPTWIDKGHGPVWILKNKSNGKVRVLQKVKDSGRVAMNFGILPGSDSYYKHESTGTGKTIKATFVDHIAKNAGPSQWAVMVGKKEDAAEIARILREEQSKL